MARKDREASNCGDVPIEIVTGGLAIYAGAG